MNILSIQSWVAYGHVGNASAMFPLQRLGAEVWAVNTVQFSNHTGYGQWTGQVFAPDSVTALVDGIAARGVLGGCDAVLSGYMGDAGTGEAVLDAVRRVRAANPAALYCCDPVIGDVGTGVYVRPGIAELLRERAVPAADILTPNRFELELLAGLPCGSVAEAAAAARALRARMAGSVGGGAATPAVLVTSLDGSDTPADALDLLAVGADGGWRLRTKRLDLAVNGAGDAIAALFLFHMLRGGSARLALERAASAVAGMLRHTLRSGSREIALVAAQDEFVRPSRMLAAEPC
jgi:pyridoxine kinase